MFVLLCINLLHYWIKKTSSERTCHVVWTFFASKASCYVDLVLIEGVFETSAWNLLSNMQFQQMTQRIRDHVTQFSYRAWTEPPPLSYSSFCSDPADTSPTHHNSHAARSCGNYLRALNCVSEDLVIQADGPARPYARHATVPLYLLRPIRNIYFSV